MDYYIGRPEGRVLRTRLPSKRPLGAKACVPLCDGNGSSNRRDISLSAKPHHRRPWQRLGLLSGRLRGFNNGFSDIDVAAQDGADSAALLKQYGFLGAVLPQGRERCE